MAKHRVGRINEEFKKELSKIINYEIKDPRITAMVSVTDVQVTNDLKYAKVYLSIFAKSPEEKQTTMKALKSASGFMRSRLSQTINLRQTPELQLLEDNSIDYGMHIDKLLKEVIKSEPVKETDEAIDEVEDEDNN